jgi:hypothetical protein
MLKRHGTGGLKMADIKTKMDEYIERSAAIEAAKHAWAKGLEPSQYIEALPAADVAPVVRGQWISFLDGDHIMPERYYRCSRCGRVESRCQPYCHCGAKMDGGDNTER